MAKMLGMFERQVTKKEWHHCSNPVCGRTFAKPKVLHVCPYCLTEIRDDPKSGSQYWFGYLGQKGKGEDIPKECIQCEKAVDCMLGKESCSETAVEEIKKWY